MFRLQDNVPDVYINESRDFQLICRLYDLIINGVMFDINSITNINNPMKVNDRLLKLYCSKVGFFTNAYIPDEVLRVILSSFNYTIKYKGTKTGIEHAVCAILKMEGSFKKPIIIIDNDNYNIRILTPITIYNKVALQEYLKHIIPAGYTFTIENSLQIPERLTELSIAEKVYIKQLETAELSEIANDTKNIDSTIVNNVIYKGVNTVAQVLSADDINYIPNKEVDNG
jgi:hypothetical protein